MHILAVFWLTLGALIALLWMRRHIDISRAQRSGFVLTPDGLPVRTAPPLPGSDVRGRHGAPATGPNIPPLISVVIAARDEAGNIRRCVGSLLDQDYPALELIVVNDRSVDETPSILDCCARDAGGRMRVHHVNEVAPGWFGKTNALQKGISDARGEFLLFTDADCDFHSPRAVTVAMDCAAIQRLDFLTVTPETSVGGFWAAAVLPVCTGILMIWHPPEKVNDPGHRAAYANGAFMLIRRHAYERIGGHSAVRDAICEDMQLARRAKSMGVRLGMMRSKGLYRTRLYGTPREAWRGWTRIMQGSLRTPGRVIAAILLLTVSSLLPWAACAWSAVEWRGSSDDGGWWPAATVLWGVACVVQQWATIRAYPIIGMRRAMALTYVPGAVLSLAILVNAFLKVMGIGATVWRGRSYRGVRVAEVAIMGGEERIRAGG